MSDTAASAAAAVAGGELTDPLLDPVDQDDPEAPVGPPTEQEKDRSLLVARVTTSCLVPAANGEYEGTAEAVDDVFKKHILPAAQMKHGYVDSIRFFDGAIGDYVLVR